MYERKKRVEELCDISTLHPDLVDYDEIVKSIIATAINDAIRYPIPVTKVYRKSIFYKKAVLFKVTFNFLKYILKKYPKSTSFIFIILEYLQYFINYLRRGWNWFDEKLSIDARGFFSKHNKLLGLYCDYLDYDQNRFVRKFWDYIHKVDKNRLNNELFLFEENLLQYGSAS